MSRDLCLEVSRRSGNLESVTELIPTLRIPLLLTSQFSIVLKSNSTTLIREGDLTTVLYPQTPEGVLVEN